MDPIKKKIIAGAAIIDVRTPEEYADGYFHNARNIPVNSLLARLDEIGPKDRPVIVYCASGGRSAVAQAMLKANGFADVTNAGGLGDMPQ